MALWAMVRGSPPGATPTPQGLKVLFTPDALYALDLDECGKRNREGPRIWMDYAHALSCGAKLSPLALIYEQKRGFDCVAYRGPEPVDDLPIFTEQVLAGDGSLSAPAVSMTSDSTKLAAVGRSDVLLLETNTGDIIKRFPIAGLGGGER